MSSIFDIYVAKLLPRVILERSEESRSADNQYPLKKSENFLKKPIDKVVKVCYHIYVNKNDNDYRFQNRRWRS